ncbi:MAG: PDZ domain-containing protein [Planctomycetota bacterium]|jgi:hypothetical protein
MRTRASLAAALLAAILLGLPAPAGPSPAGAAAGAVLLAPAPIDTERHERRWAIWGALPRGGAAFGAAAVARARAKDEAPRPDNLAVIRAATGIRFSVLESYFRRRIVSTRTRYGLRIASVRPGGPADRAGLRRGDVVLEWGGRPLDRPRQLAGWLRADAPGPVEVEYARLRADRSTWSRQPWETRAARLDPDPAPVRATETTP